MDNAHAGVLLLRDVARQPGPCAMSLHARLPPWSFWHADRWMGVDAPGFESDAKTIFLESYVWNGGFPNCSKSYES